MTANISGRRLTSDCFASSIPPFRPMDIRSIKLINSYICVGNRKAERNMPATNPSRKNRIIGSMRVPLGFRIPNEFKLT